MTPPRQRPPIVPQPNRQDIRIRNVGVSNKGRNDSNKGNIETPTRGISSNNRNTI